MAQVRDRSTGDEAPPRVLVVDDEQQCDGKLSEAARLAGLDRSNFRRIAKRCGALDDQRDE